MKLFLSSAYRIFLADEDQFLAAIVSEVDGQHVHFRLAPAYTLYLASRFRLSKMYRPEMGPTERAQRLTAFLNKIADLVDRTAQVKSLFSPSWSN